MVLLKYGKWREEWKHTQPRSRMHADRILAADHAALWTSKHTILMLLTRLVASSVAQDNDRNLWVDFDIDQWMFGVKVVFANDEGRRIDLLGLERSGRRHDGTSSM